ncbi:FAS1 domain-containing protein [Podospora fimiseda]|uniref:FAS1 domain-containing protein n=1 Tax=Podospora fimiseda TaxID=252190 RepID=A0AAN7GYX0_9PEZI|nr:FAS1 domain-containing protein [Podospora fimiseda]
MFGGGVGLRLSTSLVAFLTLFSSLSNAQQPKNAKALGEVLGGIPDLSIYYNLLKNNTDILFEIPNLAGVTLLAPSNEAFNKSQDFQPDNTTYLTTLLKYHIIRGVINTQSLSVGPSIYAPTLLTSSDQTNVSTGQNVIITRQDEETTVITTGLGSRSTISDPADISFSGGLIQIIDTLLVPPAPLEKTARDAYKDLTGFLGALYSTDLVSTFSQSKDVTILAPRNSAFQKIASPLSSLTKEKLTSILKYHLIPNKIIPASSFFIPSANFTNGTLDSQEGKQVLVTRLGNNLFFNRAQLLQADVLISNGVIHIIDGVLNPDLEESQQVPEEDVKSQSVAFTQPVSGAQTSTGTKVPVPFTSYLPCTSDCPVTTTSSAEVEEATTTTRGGVSTRSSSGMGVMPRCTGVGGYVAAGVVGVGMGMGFVGAV